MVDRRDSESDRIDKWWTGETMSQKYPTLCKVAKALVTIFDGAQVESTFSITTRIIIKQTHTLVITMPKAIQTLKYELSGQLCRNIRYSHALFKRKS